MAVADLTAQPVTVEYNGRAYQLAPPDHVKVIGDYQRYLRERALDEVDQVRVLFGPTAGEVAMGAYLDKSSAGVYDFGSPFWFQCVQNARHRARLVLSCLRVHHPDATQALADAIARTEDGAKAVRKLLFGESDPSPEISPGVPGNE